MKKKFFYFDFASTTPIEKKYVFNAMKTYFSDEFGNSSSLYSLGRHAKIAIEKSLGQISDVLRCKQDEFVFTGSATEADNLAIAGVAMANKEKGHKIIVSNIEHKGILSICSVLKKQGFEILELKVKKNGLLNPKDLENLIDNKTILVSLTYVDSETGTIQPIKDLVGVVKRFRKEKKSNFPYFHTDASQAALYLDVAVDNLGIDLMTISAHKMYGPKGIGGLYVRRGVNIKPIIYGGGQRGSLRSGTENIPGIVGFGEAFSLARKNQKKETIRIKKLRDKLEYGIFKKIPKVILNGHPTKRLPNFLNISILDIEGEALLLYLDKLGIMVSTGSACNSQNLEPSYILSALRRPYEFIHGSLRFSLGKCNEDFHINFVLKNLPTIVKKLRAISPLNLPLNINKKVSEPKAFIGGQTPHFF
ncbi:MAG: aminotransferase class V-fold PLP-dependent enzyme [Patescibacteria group bacterium]|nr:aminotransferase class V-fold PLP-dependent enzyme [Patescibacteria group bacterium]